MADIPEKYSDLDFTPPKAAQKNAKKALRWKEEHPNEVDGGTQVGWTRANQLADGGELSPDIVQRMAQFNRHRSNSEIADEYEGEPWKDNGYLAWQLWGGDEGVDWAIRLSDRMEEIDKQQNESVDPINEFLTRIDESCGCGCASRKKESKSNGEEKLREAIRKMIVETIFGREFSYNADFYNKDTDKRLGSYSSETAKIIFFKQSEKKIYMKVTNKRTGKTSGKIYVENVDELLDVLDIVNVIT